MYQRRRRIWMVIQAVFMMKKKGEPRRIRGRDGNHLHGSIVCFGISGTWTGHTIPRKLPLASRRVYISRFQTRTTPPWFHGWYPDDRMDLKTSIEQALAQLHLFLATHFIAVAAPSRSPGGYRNYLCSCALRSRIHLLLISSLIKDCSLFAPELMNFG